MATMQQDFSLQKMNSFGLAARTSLFAVPDTIDSLASMLDSYDYSQHAFLVMGEGSNILFKSDFEGLIIRPGMSGIEVVEENKKEVWVKVGASENWDSWIAVATENNWHGLENLSLIPGSVGSAPVQNIGAYGVELKDYFAWVDAWDLHQKRLVQLNPEACRFGYRSSIFKKEQKGRYIICSVTFRLSKTPRLQLNYGPVKEAFIQAGGESSKDLRDAIISIRRQKLPDPDDYGNAGSFFKNPLVDQTMHKSISLDYPRVPAYPEKRNQVKVPAAWLIEKAGWKGKRAGNVGTWPSQPLVIVNYGGASGEEVLEFSERIRRDVETKFGIWLEREVNVI